MVPLKLFHQYLWPNKTVKFAYSNFLTFIIKQSYINCMRHKKLIRVFFTILNIGET